VGRDTGNLKSKEVEKLIQAGKPGKHYDGQGLRLEIKGPNKTSWVARYQIDGVTRYMGLGGAKTFNLAEARERNRKLVRQKLADGVDPVALRRVNRAAAQAAAAKAMTFAEAGCRFLEQHSAKWDSLKHRSQWENTLRNYADPIIGALPVADIDVPLVLRVLEQPLRAERNYPAGPLWSARPETANRLRGRIEAVLDWAKARGRRTGDNPAAWDIIGKVLPARGGPKHHAALPYKDIPAFIAALRERQGVAARALEFTILCAARSQEVLRARWCEFDLNASSGAIWTVPPERMKMRRLHRVPLSSAAVELLRALPREGDGDGFVFIGAQAGKPLGHSTLQMLLKRMHEAATPHGFRSTFRDWAGERTAFPHDVCEAALAHSKDKTERAYQRADLFDKRRQLMAAWAKFCASSAPKNQAERDVLVLRGAPMRP
jgi:integrase